MNTIKIDELTIQYNKIREKLFPLEQKAYKINEEIKRLKKIDEEIILELYKEVVAKFEDAGAEYIFVEFKGKPGFVSVIEDDGTLHITDGKIRGCFICNQDLTKTRWNKEAKEVMKKLNLPLSLLKNI